MFFALIGVTSIEVVCSTELVVGLVCVAMVI